jgi:hypothetical protein
VHSGLDGADYNAWVHGQRRFYLRWPIFWLYTVPRIAVGVFLIALGAQKGNVGMILAGIAILVFWLCLTGVVPVRGWSRNPSLRESRTVTLDEQGMRIETAAWNSDSEWTRFSRKLESDSNYQLLWKMGTLTVPKRSFATPADETRFRSLVSDHVSRGSFRTASATG